MTAVVLAVASFLAMEVVSYATHRWVMHGFGWSWHASHHDVARGGFERNDRFPFAFAAVGVGLFVGAQAVSWLWWVAIGVTAYGAAYLVVHEILIHRRVRCSWRGGPYVRWVRDAHRAHHVRGGEPFGMLVPVVRDAVRTVEGDDRLIRARRSSRR